jgi:transposase
LKREIVAASLVAGASVSVVARRYDVNANQVFSWRRRYRDGSAAPAAAISSRLIPVMVTAARRHDVMPGSPAADAIEIELCGGYRVCVFSGVDGPALRRVIDVLERR